MALLFMLAIGAIFAAIFALEGDPRSTVRRPAGLLTWIASGNWPAKVGGGLIIIGVGALLRYAVINFELPPGWKLSIGMGITALLGVGSMLTAAHPQRRAISLALGGAAFGVAYLTAYSSFALFGYLPTLPGLGLLALTAVGAGVFAASRSALSLAVLSLLGAFMAPAFAVEDPGVQVVYGYYVAISALTLCMVSLRGWRPLIHLSFLFTLAGSGFFAWTSEYFTRGQAPALLPLLLALVAIHVAMPLFERRAARGAVLESLDTIYLLALPVVAALTVLFIAPSRGVLSQALWWFAAIWLVAAAWLYRQRRDAMASHAIIGLLFAALGLAARMRNLPWELVALAFSVASLVLAARRSTSSGLQGFLAGLVLLLGAVHMVSALAPGDDTVLFFNARFLERLVGAGLLIVAAITLSRMRHSFDSLMITVALCWTAFALGAEVARLELVSAWLVLHWLLALLAISLYFLARRFPRAQGYITPLVLALGVSAVQAQLRTSVELAWVSAALASAGMLAIALRPMDEAEGTSPGRLLAAIGAPLIAAVWMTRVARVEPDMHWQFPVAVAAGFAGFVLLLGARVPQRSARWFDEATDMFALGFAFALAVATLFDIERDVAAVLLEITCVAALMSIAMIEGARAQGGEWIGPAAVVGAALTLQANLLRALGPAGHLTAADITQMQWPTVVSLLWASIGAALTIWSRRTGSRALWSAGAAFLVGSAVKLLLLDFGSLGQLANILAVIAAGGVFLLVGWLAPMPPARAVAPEDPPDGLKTHAAAGAPRERNERSGSRLAWTIAMAGIALLTFSQCRSKILRPQHQPQAAVYPEIFESAQPPPEEYASSTPKEALHTLVARGVLRHATVDDYRKWRGQPPAYTNAPQALMSNVYVVLAPMAYPQGMHSAEHVTFLLPRGIPRPTGDPGQAELIEAP